MMRIGHSAFWAYPFSPRFSGRLSLSRSRRQFRHLGALLVEAPGRVLSPFRHANTYEGVGIKEHGRLRSFPAATTREVGRENAMKQAPLPKEERQKPYHYY